jgi:hypothetical protein
LGMAASEPPSGDNHVTPFSSIQMPLANSSIHPGSRRMGARGPGASGDPPRRRGAPSDSVATDHDMWEGGDEEAPGDAAGDAGRGGAFAGPHLHLERGTGSTYRSLFGREAGGAAGGRVDACLMPPGFAGAGRPLGPDDTPMDEKEGGRQEGLRPVPHDELELQDGEDVEEWASAVLAGLKAQEPARQPSQDPKRCVSLQVRGHTRRCGCRTLPMHLCTGLCTGLACMPSTDVPSLLVGLAAVSTHVGKVLCRTAFVACAHTMQPPPPPHCTGGINLTSLSLTPPPPHLPTRRTGCRQPLATMQQETCPT